MRTSSFQFIILTVGGCLTGCGQTDNASPPAGSGGDQSVGGATSTAVGSLATGGSAQVGGGVSTGGAATGGSIPGAGGATGGSPQTGGSKATVAGGATAIGSSNATGGMAPTGGKPATGGAATGGKAPTGGAATGGTKAAGGSAATGGAAAGASATAGAASVGDPDCSTAMPTGGKTYSGSSVNGTADGLNYGIWATGSGGSITVFTTAHAFSAAWNGVSDFLAHVGLDFNTAKDYTTYGKISAQFVEIKSGTAGNWSSIGIYGWMHSPCVEWYINEDSFNGLYANGGATATIDGATYNMTTSTTTGTGGANACESGHTGSWTQMISTRKTARQCGTITVSDHFKAWAAQGWSLGTLASVHINVETGGGTGSIQFPVANVTAN